METKQRSSQTFCARCGLAKSGHGFLGGACSNFIQPGSKEAHEAKRAHLSVVETPAPVVSGHKWEQQLATDAQINFWGHSQECSMRRDRVTCDCGMCDEGAGSHPGGAIPETHGPAPEVTKPIDGNVLDRVLLAGALEHQNEAIEAAKQHLIAGLRSQRAGMPKFATECFAAALLALGNLGAA